MSLGGPRPGLLSQTALTEARARAGVFKARPGITGLAQLRGIDMFTPQTLAEFDALLIKELTVANYFRYVITTVLGGGSGDRVRL